jgi:hypothetical protein
MVPKISSKGEGLIYIIYEHHCTFHFIDLSIIGFCQRYLILPRRLINATQAQHKINKQAYVGLLHQIVQSNSFVADKYTPSNLEGPSPYFVIGRRATHTRSRRPPCLPVSYISITFSSFSSNKFINFNRPLPFIFSICLPASYFSIAFSSRQIHELQPPLTTHFFSLSPCILFLHYILFSP